jgi:thiamine kinase-like enzyme
VEWLESRCLELTGVRCAFVAAHNDLTMFNVLLEGDGLGVVDWECARAYDLPLGDLAYAAVDAAAAAARYGDRVAAYERAFGTGPVAAQVDELVRRICRAVDVDDELAELCLHSTWLRHAANEQRDGSSATFLSILRRLVPSTGHR